MAIITAQFGEPIRQYAGEVQARRRVKVLAPGKHFPGLMPAEAKEDYWATAVEYSQDRGLLGFVHEIEISRDTPGFFLRSLNKHKRLA